MIRSLVLTLVFIGSAACSKKNVYEGYRPEGLKFAIIEMDDFQEKFQLPKPLLAEIEKVYLPLALNNQEAHSEGGHGSEPKLETKKKEGDEEEEEDDLMKRRPPQDPFSFTIYLIEQTPGVLNNTHYELQFKEGGGTLDLKKFVNEKKKGVFRMIVQIEDELDRENFHVFFLSQGKKRDVKGKEVGNGCHRYFELSTFWAKAMQEEGIVLNTRDDKYVSLISGVFNFVSSVRGKLRLAHLTIRDSRYGDLVCYTGS